MSFDDFIETAWNDHADRAQEVADRLLSSRTVVAAPADIAPFARLVTHVYGEHLGQWDAGVALLNSLRDLPCWDAGAAASGVVERGVAVLRYCGNGDRALDALSAEDRIAVLATASSAFVGRNECKRGLAAFAVAKELANAGLPEGSPAFRALAVGGNNLAAALEEKPDRDATETAGMVNAAEAGVTYWKLAGTWLEEERAYYRLARSLLQAGNPQEAARSAQRCVEICSGNQAPPIETFFGFAVLSIAQRACGDRDRSEQSRLQAMQSYELVPAEEKQWCESDLKELGT